MSAKRWRFHAAAYEEMVDAARWYQQEAGLGTAYLAAVERTIEQLKERATIAIVLPGVPPEFGVRRLFVKTFPYAVAFVEGDDEFTIVAVMHLRRRPGYWRRRLRGRIQRK